MHDGVYESNEKTIVESSIFHLIMKLPQGLYYVCVIRKVRNECLHTKSYKICEIRMKFNDQH